jgi:hypothetical protein
MIVEKSFIKVTNADGTIAVADYFDSARVETSQTVETDHAITPMGLIDLPDEGTVEKGMYNYNGTVVFCHQKHERTIYEPIETPALFTIFRTNSDTLEWIQNEKVELGWKRMYNSVQYECIQAHMTLETWEPDKATTLWRKVQTDELTEWVQPTGGHDAYNIGDRVLFNGSIYESVINANVWSPSAYPAGWSLVS